MEVLRFNYNTKTTKCIVLQEVHFCSGLDQTFSVAFSLKVISHVEFKI